MMSIKLVYIGIFYASCTVLERMVVPECGIEVCDTASVTPMSASPTHPWEDKE